MQTMEILKEIRNRYSVRRYQDRVVEWDKIEKCLEAAHLAPSACNKQPWRFVVIDDRQLKDELCKACFNFPPKFNKFAFEAPVIVAVCAEPDFLTHTLIGHIQDLPYYLLDIGASIENFMLQAVSLGLGSCWIGWFNEKSAKKLLKLPKSFKIVSLFTLGYPKEQGIPEKKRKPLKEIYEINL